MQTIISILITLVASALFALVAALIGGFLAGLDRILSARMQGRVGPPVLQPFYDVIKLFSKEGVRVNGVMDAYIMVALLFVAVAGGIFFTGGNLLLCVFVLTLGELFFILAAWSARSPYSDLGAQRETLQVMAYEPMILLMAVAYYLTTGSFDVSAVLRMPSPIIGVAFGVFIGFLFVLTIKLRKSPFDLSYSHHAHQDLVKGVTTEMSGPTLGYVEVMHWLENVLFLGWVGMFFVWASPLSIPVVLVALVLVFFLEIWIDNNFARVKWQALLWSAWLVTLVFCGVNLTALACL